MPRRVRKVTECRSPSVGGPTLDSALNAAGLPALEARGQGYQVEGRANVPPEHFYSLKALTPDEYTPFRLDDANINDFAHPTLHRTREEAIYRGPLLVCPKASLKTAPELGRYSAAVSPHDLLYTESFYGVSYQPPWPLTLT